MKLATTCSKNEQQQDAQTNAELYTKWAKATWDTFEETIRRGRNRSISPLKTTRICFI
jgi:23S rRNA maturation mini-RNase III